MARLGGPALRHHATRAFPLSRGAWKGHRTARSARGTRGANGARHRLARQRTGPHAVTGVDELRAGLVVPAAPGTPSFGLWLTTSTKSRAGWSWPRAVRNLRRGVRIRTRICVAASPGAHTHNCGCISSPATLVGYKPRNASPPIAASTCQAQSLRAKSLYRGRYGVALLQEALLKPQDASMPLFCSEQWPGAPRG